MRKPATRAVRQGGRLLAHQGAAVGTEIPDTPVTDVAIRAEFNISAASLRGWRLKGFPEPDFYVERRAYTWWSRIVAWTKKQPATSPIAGRQVIGAASGSRRRKRFPSAGDGRRSVHGRADGGRTHRTNQCM